MNIDLHSHSNVSDGTQPPADVVRRAHAAGVNVLALTDHDTIAGWADAAAALPGGMTLVPGIELSCARGGHSLHLLGYLFDPARPEMVTELQRLRTARVGRAKAMVTRLQELGALTGMSAMATVRGRDE